MNSELLELWPDDRAVADCMKTDAEAASEGVSMAVHQPVMFERRRIGGEGSLSPCDEAQFLEAFLEPTLSDGRVIAPLVGRSGTGKSHIIRWIAATLNHLPGAELRVVIRMPKGTSLKGVLDILLEKLTEPEYEPFRAKLRTANDQLDSERSAGLLCEMLAQTLAEKVISAKAKLLGNPMDKAAREILDYGKADILQTLLVNKGLRDRHFVREPSHAASPIRRLVEQLSHSKGVEDEGDKQYFFVPDDLDFNGVDTSDLGQAVKTAILLLGRPDRKAAACRVLNDALDEAKQSLLGIDPTVTELFDAVRKKLLEQGKELILLIEDFVVFSGIQKQILQVVIKEGIRDGKQVLCTMRTVLAYTSGYLDTATVLTRAGIEYVIPDMLSSEEEIFEKVENLVGAYLNAARLGQRLLEELYNREALDTRSQQNWVPNFESGVDEAAQRMVDSFGITGRGYSLFPFNRAAIRELSRDGCLQAGQLVYNPRFVIQNVLKKVLKHRLDFELGNFPPEELHSSTRRLGARVQEDVRSRVLPQDFERWVRFLSFWGGRPATTDDLAGLSAKIPMAFGLDPSRLNLPAEANADVSRQQVETNSTSPTAPVAAKAVIASLPPERSPAELQFEENLQRWRNNIPLTQPQALHIRKLLSEALEQAITWDWDLFMPLENVSKFFDAIYIPNAGGNAGNKQDSKSTMFALCTDEDARDMDRSGTVSLALLAMFRHRVIYKGSWDYPESDEDLPRYTALIQRFVDATKAFVMMRYLRTSEDPLPALVQGLAIGSKALGLDRTTRGLDRPAVHAGLFLMPPEDEHNFLQSPTAFEKDPWDEFTAKLFAIRKTSNSRSGTSWTEHVLNLVGARQGGGSIVYAVDASRLKTPVDMAHKTLVFDMTIPAGGSAENERFRTAYNDLKGASRAVEKEAAVLRSWRDEVVAWAGANPDKDLMVQAFKDLVERARNASLAVGLDGGTLLKSVEEFRDSSFKGTFDDICRLSDSPPRAVILVVLGSKHRKVMNIARDLRKRLDEFLGGLQNALKSKSILLTDDPRAEAIHALEHEIELLVPIVKEIAAL
jgi:hypothetical protein